MKPEDYNRRAIRALERAQKARGVRSGQAFARLLAERAGGSPSGTTYHRWLNGEATVPAWVLDVAAEVAQVDLGILLADDERASDLTERVHDLEGKLVTVLELMKRLQGSVDLHGEMFEEMSKHAVPDSEAARGAVRPTHP